MTRKLVIFGAGYPIIIQHIDDINLGDGDKFEIVGFAVDDPDQKGKVYFGYPILGKLEDIQLHSDVFVINYIGSSTRARKAVDERIYRIKNHVPSLIHPNVERRYSQIGEGCIISKDTYIGAGSLIGNSVCLRNTIFIGNEVTIGNGVFISDQTVILGYINIENYAYLGANVTVLPRLVLGSNSTLGAGAVATKSIPDNEVWVGNPAKYIKLNAPL